MGKLSDLHLRNSIEHDPFASSPFDLFRAHLTLFFPSSYFIVINDNSTTRTKIEFCELPNIQLVSMRGNSGYNLRSLKQTSLFMREQVNGERDTTSAKSTATTSLNVVAIVVVAVFDVVKRQWKNNGFLSTRFAIVSQTRDSSRRQMRRLLSISGRSTELLSNETCNCNKEEKSEKRGAKQCVRLATDELAPPS